MRASIKKVTKNNEFLRHLVVALSAFVFVVVVVFLLHQAKKQGVDST